jgi:uncharacterized phage protein (TIGR02218 family)
MSRVIPPALLAALRSRTSFLCYCWQAIRQDGEIFGFTDHDVDVVFDAGDGHGSITYKASTSFMASDIQDQLGLAVSNVDILGAISDAAITTADIEDDRWDNAFITIFVVDYTNPAAANTIMVSGTTGQITNGDLAFQAELRGLSQYLQQYIGSLIQQTCRSDMFDTGTGPDHGCNFPKPPPVPGLIASVISRTSFSVTPTNTGSLSFPDGTKGSLSGGYFAYGTVTFLSGKNAGVSREVFTSDPSLNFVTMLPFPDDITDGDEVEMQFGCDKSLEVCRDNYDNVINMRCEPYVPGSDFVFRVNGEQS